MGKHWMDELQKSSLDRCEKRSTGSIHALEDAHFGSSGLDVGGETPAF